MTYDDLTLGSVYQLYPFSDNVYFTLVGMGMDGYDRILVFQCPERGVDLSLIRKVRASVVFNRYPDIQYSESFNADGFVVLLGDQSLSALTPVSSRRLSITGLDDSVNIFTYNSLSDLASVFSDYDILIASNVVLGDGVCLGRGCVVESNCKLGSNVQVGFSSIIRSGSVVGDNAAIGSDVIIGSHSIVSEGVKISNGCLFGAESVISMGVAKSLYIQLRGVEISYWGDSFVNIATGSYLVSDFGRGIDNVIDFCRCDESLSSSVRTLGYPAPCTLDFQDCFALERVRELLADYISYYDKK